MRPDPRNQGEPPATAPTEPPPSSEPESRTGGGEGTATASPALEWSFNPWRERPIASALALLFTAASLVLLASIGFPALGVAVLGLALVASLAPLLLPVRCRVDEEGVACRGPLGWERRRWSNIRRVARVRIGLLASPFEEPRPLDRYRALILPMPREERHEIISRITPRLARHGF